MYVMTDTDGRIIQSADTPFDGSVEITLPDSFAPERQQDWKVIDGVISYDPIPETPGEDVETRLALLEGAVTDMIIAQYSAGDAT